MISKMICDCLEISKRSNVPMLFLSNPGVGKTTAVKKYGEINGYNVVELRGNQSSPEDILGFYVNNPKTKALELKFPSWFTRIVDGKKPTILFIDEITTANEFTQAALLKLIFDREIDTVKLPNNCLIVAAGNYISNLSNSFGLIAPMLNRFCIINITMENNNIYDYLKIKPSIDCRYVYQSNSVKNDEVEHMVSTYLQALFDTFNIKRTPEFYLDLQNKDFSKMNEMDTNIYGILSPRTAHYLTKCTKAIVETKDQLDKSTIDEIVKGLIGAGTLTFQNAGYIKSYHNQLIDIYHKMLETL